MSNGNPREQALIRKWWYETHNARGQMVWEYYLEGRYADAIWFPDTDSVGLECSGKNAPFRHPILAANIILCEAKLTLNPEVVGQALIYTRFAIRAGANVIRTLVFCETGTNSMQAAARDLGLKLVIHSL